MSIRKSIVIGAGITGLSLALTLTIHNHLSVSIFEIRPEPATIGGAINLTPNALRYLDHLGVLAKLQPKGCEVKYIDICSQRTGQTLGTIDFSKKQKFRHHALRIMRSELLTALLKTAEEKGIQVQYSKRICSISETSSKITASFEDGAEETADLLFGCDGIHSAVRTKFVDLDRQAEYSGVSNAYGFLNVDDELRSRLQVDSTTLFFSRCGSLLMSYSNSEKTQLYVSAVMSSPAVGSREGWAVKGGDKEALKKDFSRRFQSPKLTVVDKIVESLDNLILYPVYRLGPGGVWSKGRVMLLGDAAHAMPPQGESVGLALEDTVLFSRILSHYSNDASPPKIFECYEKHRRPRIDAALKEANFGWETIRDRGWFGTIVMEWLTWAFLAWRAKRKEEEYAFDVRNIDLDVKV